MRDNRRARDGAQIGVVRGGAKREDGGLISGLFNVKIVREGQEIYNKDCPNVIVNEGVGEMFDRMFTAQPGNVNWYMGLLDNASLSVAATDTLATHIASEFSNYSDASPGGGTSSLRPNWAAQTTVTDSLRKVDNTGTPITFTISGAGGDVDGLFIHTQQTIGSSTGTLFSVVVIASAPAVTSGDQVIVTYTASIS